MKLAFLGSGAAFSLERYNGAVVVEDRFLLDAGAPLLPHMHRLGIDPGGIAAVLLGEPKFLVAAIVSAVVAVVFVSLTLE